MNTRDSLHIIFYKNVFFPWKCWCVGGNKNMHWGSSVFTFPISRNCKNFLCCFGSVGKISDFQSYVMGLSPNLSSHFLLYIQKRGYTTWFKRRSWLLTRNWLILVMKTEKNTCVCETLCPHRGHRVKVAKWSTMAYLKVFDLMKMHTKYAIAVPNTDQVTKMVYVYEVLWL